MDGLRRLIDFILHFDDHLHGFLEHYGAWTYAILFLIIFCETGLVVTPFLPGDSLLFAAGMFAGLYPDALNIYLLLILLTVAAIAGEALCGRALPLIARSRAASGWVTCVSRFVSVTTT